MRVAEDGRVGHEDDGADGRDDGEDKACLHRQLLVLRRGDGDGTRGDEDERDRNACEDW